MDAFCVCALVCALARPFGLTIGAVSSFIVDVTHTKCGADRPVCRHDQKRIYGVARNEMAKILCEVDAYPAPTSFKWSFNNTAETIDMPQNGFEKHSRTSSRLSYTPVKVCYLLFASNYTFQSHTRAQQMLAIAAHKHRRNRRLCDYTPWQYIYV